jgi:hypothetical protein
MKTIIPFITLILFTLPLYSQIMGSWSSPLAITDSTSDNSNPVVVVWYDELYLFYNKYDEPYRNVWWKKISEPMTEEQMLFGVWPELDYRNPQMLFNNFLILEINVFDGEYDIFAAKVDTTGIVGDFFPLTNTPYDENSFFGYNSYSGICCWEGEGNIYLAEPQISEDTLILAEIELIDSGNCYDPVCQEGYVTWRKVESNESHIYYSEKNWSTNQWSDPAAIIDTGNNINLALSISVPELYGWGYNISWEAKDKIYFTDLDGGIPTFPEIPGIEKYHEPDAFNIIWLTDYISDLYSFVGETDSVRDIYIVDEEVSNYILNITNDPNIDKNPRFFIGRPTYEYSTFYEIINIWQKEINGNDVLYFSSSLYNVVIGNTLENDMTHVTIFPNPAPQGSFLQINFSEVIADDFNISILNNHGQIVDEFNVEKNNSKEISVGWNKGNLPAGIYYLVVRTKNETFTEKFIIL